jgi:N-acetyl-1-D-myo-inositol-2-amino-2-deoxy-alpha-D-glucopyranoside deacetylase
LRLLTVHAHADDETITMGGLLSVYTDQGVHVRLVTCTDGQLATIFDPSMEEETTRPILGDVRRAELRNACAVLGVQEIEFLGYHDSGMAGEGTNHDPVAFWKADVEEVVARLVPQIRAFRPQVVVTYDANGGYGHPDHIQAHRVTVLAIEAANEHAMYPDSGAPWQVSKLYYTAFPRSSAKTMSDLAAAAGVQPPWGDVAVEDLPFTTPDHLVTAHIDVKAGVPRKRDALRAHRSQIAPDFPMVAISDELALEVLGEEHFQRAWSRIPAPAQEHDLFAGVRET